MIASSSIGGTELGSGRYEWAEHLHWMEGGMEPAPQTKPKDSRKSLWPGFLLATGIGSGAFVLSSSGLLSGIRVNGQQVLDPVMLAIVTGILVGNLFRLPTALGDGVKCAIKILLPLGVILLGARLNLHDLLKLGVGGLGLSVSGVGVALVFSCMAGKLLKLSIEEQILIGVGTAICGGTAIIALAPIIAAREGTVAVTVTTVTVLGLGAMLLMPVLGAIFGLSPVVYGAWAGLAIHQTPQVIAAGFAFGPEAGETATVVKLMRVCLLVPVAIVLGIWASRWNSAGAKRPLLRLIPPFLYGFLLLVLANTAELLPGVQLHWKALPLLGQTGWEGSFSGLMTLISSILLTISMAGVGLETRLRDLPRTSGRIFLAGTIASLAVAIAAFFGARLIF